MIRIFSLYFIKTDLVISEDFHLCAKCTDLLDKIICEGVVIIDNEYHIYFYFLALRY